MKLFRPPSIDKLKKQKKEKKLLEELSNSDTSRKNQAIDALIEIGKSDSLLQYWTETLKSDPQLIFNIFLEKASSNINSDDINCRITTVKMLGNIKDIKSVNLLIKLLEDCEYSDRNGEVVSQVSVAAEESLIKLGGLAIETLISNLKRNEKPTDWLIRLKSARILGLIGDTKATKPLINALNDNESATRQEVIKALCDIGESSIELLIETSKQEDPLKQLGAYEALAILGNPDAVKPIIDALKNDDLSIKRQAIRALGKINDSRAIESLLIILDEYEKDLRIYSIMSLVMIKEGQDALIRLLSTRENWGRRSGSIDAFSDTINYGNITEDVKNNIKKVIKISIKNGFGSVEIMTLLRLLKQAGDYKADMIFESLNSGNHAYVEALIRQL